MKRLSRDLILILENYQRSKKLCGRSRAYKVNRGTYAVISDGWKKFKFNGIYRVLRCACTHCVGYEPNLNRRGTMKRCNPSASNLYTDSV